MSPFTLKFNDREFTVRKNITGATEVYFGHILIHEAHNRPLYEAAESVIASEQDVSLQLIVEE